MTEMLCYVCIFEKPHKNVEKCAIRKPVSTIIIPLNRRDVAKNIKMINCTAPQTSVSTFS